MNICQKSIKDLIPYDKNPRKNDKAVEYVAESIRQFGFKVPIVIDRNNVIVAGHTRYKASLELGLEEVPCIIADDLSEEQVKAFRLADNKVSEQAEWDFDLLDDELEDILEIDMSDFGFDLSLDDIPEEEHNERERTDDAYNLKDFDKSRTEGYYEMPTLERIDYFPTDLIGFNYMLTSENKETGIHFFVDDYQFERIWNSPYEYLNKLSEYECALTPDFSLYMDMPMAMKIWNVYRSRMIGQIMQDYGIKVIPTVSWAEEATFEWCFDGIPKFSTVAISTVGVMNNDIAYQIFCAGADAMIKKLKPKNIICYGNKPDYDFGNINVRYYKNHVTEKWEKKDEES